MAQSEFFSDNKYRAFPFIFGTVQQKDIVLNVEDLSYSTLVDAGFTVLNGIFNSADHTVYLQDILVSGSEVTFVVATDCPSITDPLNFTFNLDDRFITQFSEVVDEDQCDTIQWHGYLTVGQIPDDIANLTRSSDKAIFEPTLVENLAGRHVLTLNVANSDRTRVKLPERCFQPTYSYTLNSNYVVATCLQGDLVISPGVNCSSSQTADGIKFSAVPVSKLQTSADPISVFPGETPPTSGGGSQLDGTHLCNEVLRTINGSGGPNHQIRGGPGVTITADPDNYKVLVHINSEVLGSC